MEIAFDSQLSHIERARRRKGTVSTESLYATISEVGAPEDGLFCPFDVGLRQGIVSIKSEDEVASGCSDTLVEASGRPAGQVMMHNYKRSLFLERLQHSRSLVGTSVIDDHDLVRGSSLTASTGNCFSEESSLLMAPHHHADCG
jgi:hypothetical protein